MSQSVEPSTPATADPAIVISHDLPEPTSYRGQHLIPIPVDPDAWLSFMGLSYSLALDDDLEPGTFGLSLALDAEAVLKVRIFNQDGMRIGDDFSVQGPTPPFSAETNQAIPVTALPGTSLSIRFVYDTATNALMVPLDFGSHLAEILDRRRLAFRMAPRPVALTRLARLHRQRRDPTAPLLYVHGFDDPETGYETPATRLPPIALTTKRVIEAWQAAKATGYFDPAVFPNVAAGDDPDSRAGALAAVADLDEATVVSQLQAGARLAVHRAASGRYTYRFLPAPERCEPGLMLVEQYQLSSFPARYGVGRTIKTFSLLPGERTTIRVNTYKRSAESLQRSSSILDATTSETESEFERTVNAEQSSQATASKGLEYHAEAEAEGKGNWGTASVSAKVSGGVSGSANSAREEFAKNLTNAVNSNAARASSRREVQVDTSMDVKLEAGEEQAVERELSNINVSRTLNFVFRQMNQEYVTLLHLVDVRVAFFNGHAESRDEVPLAELDRLLNDCVLPERVDTARQRVLEAVRAIKDYRDQPQPAFIRTTAPGTATATAAGAGAGGETGGPPTVESASVDTAFTSSYTSPEGEVYTVPGIILAANHHVLRTDGVVVDTFLGEGSGLDAYAVGLQTQAVRAREVDNTAREVDSELRRLELEKLKLALKIVTDNDAQRADLFRRLFYRPQIVNQIDHAAVTAQPTDAEPPDVPAVDGQATTPPAR